MCVGSVVPIACEMFLPENIRAAIDTRNTVRKQNPTDSQLAPLNNNIHKMIQENKQQLWKEHLTNNWDHRSNKHKL